MKEEIKKRLAAINSGFTDEPLRYKNKVLPNQGYLLIDVPDTLLHILNQERIKIESDFNKGKKFNEYLAGQLEKEYEIIDSKKLLETFVKIAAKEYCVVNEVKHTSNNFQLDNVWINFQKKYEFNPNHTHSGFLSFVIWLDIPYNIEDEFNQNLSKYSNQPSAGCFEFVYANILGEISNEVLPIDKSYNGKMIIFPAFLTHAVYPFYTSDEYRVSISGNLRK